MSAPEQTSSDDTEPGRVRRAAAAVVSKPRDAAKAIGGGFRWAGGGVASHLRSAAGAVGGKGKGVRGAVASKTGSRWNSAKERFQAKPWIGIAAILGVLFLVAWIGWAIYVGTEHGGNAALGVVISWPAVLMALALVVAPFAGLYILIRRLQGDEAASDTSAG